MTDPTITPAQPLPFNEWITRKGSTVPGPDEYRDYVDYANTELLRNGLYDDQLAAEIEQEVATLAAESGVTADPNDYLRARRPDQDFDLLTRRAIETGDEDMGNAVRTYQAVKGSRDIYDDEVEYQRKLEEARLAAEPFLDPERVNDARRAALDRGDLPFVVIDQGGDKPPLIQFGPAAADIRTDEDLAAAFDANPDLDRRFIGAVRQKIQPLPGFDAPAWAIDRQMDFQAAAAQTKITDTERYRLMVRDIANGNTDAFDRTLADLSTDPAFASFTQDERRNFLMDMAKMQGQPEVDPQNVAASLRTLSTGQVHIPNAVLFNKGYFDQALQAVPEGQRQTVQAQRQAHMEAVAPDLFKSIAEFSTFTKDDPSDPFRTVFVDFYEQAKAAGKSNGEILDEWMSNPDNHSKFWTRARGLTMGAVSAVTDIPISLAALAGSDTARDILVENQRRESARKQYANLFGDKLGIGYDAANLIAPVGVDLTLAAAAGPTGGATVGLLAAKTGAKAVVKSALRRSLSAETKTLLSQFTRKAATRQATRQGLDTVTTPISTSAVLTLAGRDFAQTASRSATQATVLGTAFTRSAGSTYASLHATLSNERNADGTPRYTPEQVREIALGHGLTAGAITASVVGAFQFLGAAGVERLLSGGFTPAQARQIYARLKLNPEIAKQYGVSLESPEKMIESAVRNATTNFLRAGVEEGGEEFVDQMAQAVNESIATGERFDVVKATKDALYAGTLGFAMGAGMTGAQRLANRPLGEDRLQAERRSALLQLANKFDAHSPNTAAALRAAAAEPPPTPTQEDVPAPPAAGGTQQAPSDAGVAPAPEGEVTPPAPAPLAPEAIERNQREIAANEEEIQKLTARKGGTEKAQQGRLKKIEALQARNAELRQRSGPVEQEIPAAPEPETDPETQDIANEVEQTLAEFPAPTGTPTESLPTDTPTSGDVGTAVQPELPGTEQPRQRTLSGMRDAVNRRLDQMEEDGTGDPTRLTALLGRIEAKMLRDNAEGADAVRARYASAVPGQTVTADAPREVREVMETEATVQDAPDEVQDAMEAGEAQSAETVQDAPEAGEVRNPDFSVDEKLVMHSPYSGEDSEVSFRGFHNGGSIVWTGKTQMQVPNAWLRKQGEPYVETPESKFVSKYESLNDEQVAVSEPEELPMPTTKAGLIAEYAGPKPTTGYRYEQEHAELVKKLQKFTVADLRSRVKDQRERRAKEAKRAEITKINFDPIKGRVESAGSKWRSELKNIAAENGDEKFSSMMDNPMGEEIYRLASRLADRGVSLQPSPIESPPDAPTELDITDIVEPPAPDEQIVENVAAAPAPELAIETPRIRKTVKRKLKSKGIDADGMTDVELAAQVTLGAAKPTVDPKVAKAEIIAALEAELAKLPKVNPDDYINDVQQGLAEQQIIQDRGESLFAEIVTSSGTRIKLVRTTANIESALKNAKRMSAGPVKPSKPKTSFPKTDVQRTEKVGFTEQTIRRTDEELSQDDSIILGLQDSDYRAKLVKRLTDARVTELEDALLAREGVTRAELNGQTPPPQDTPPDGGGAPATPQPGDSITFTANVPGAMTPIQGVVKEIKPNGSIVASANGINYPNAQIVGDERQQPAVSDTPVARDLQRLGIQDGSAAFLRNVIERGPKDYKVIARILSAFTLPNPTLVDLPDANYAGAFVASTRQILINVARRGPRGPVDTVMHELIHAALEDSLRNPTDAQRKILNRLERIRQTVMKRAEELGNRDVNYGLSSMDEFFTHFLTSPEFQRQIGAMTPKGQRNWVEVILDALRSLFGAKLKTEADKQIETIWNDMIRFTESAAAEQTYGLSRMDQLRMQPADLRDLSRFKELTADLGETPTQADIDAWKTANPDKYAELQRMREAVLRDAGYKSSFVHGTRDLWTEWDADRAGGLINLAETRDIAERYAQGGGGYRSIGNPNIVTSEEVWMFNDDTESYTNQSGDSMTLQQAQRFVEENEDDVELNYPSGRVISLFAQTGNTLDLTTSEGVKVLAGLTYKTRAGQAVVENARRGSFYWDTTKHEAISKHWKNELNPQLKALGYNSIRFKDDTHTTTAVFDPSQIKSAEPLNLDAEGRLITPDRWADTDSPDIRFQPALQATDPFYSQLQRTVAAKIPARATPDQIMATVKAAGVKSEEIKWSGIEQALGSLAVDGKVEKAALMKYLGEEGSVRFEEVVTGSQTMPVNLRWEQSTDNMQMATLPNGNVITAYYDPQNPNDGATLSVMTNDAVDISGEREYATLEEAKAAASGLVDEFQQNTATRYGQYVLPGGENYREVVLAMSEKPDTAPSLTEWMESKGYPQSEKPIRAGEYQREFPPRDKTSYTSSHFPDVPNYVAHMRLNERTDAEGNPGLFIEEIQSDRHQAGRTKGYKQNLPFQNFEQWRSANGVSDADADVAWKTQSGQIWDRWTKDRDAQAADVGAIADAPFRTTWPLALFKRALRDAVASGKDWIGWTVGDTQNGRFDLSKQIEAIEWNEDTEEFRGIPRNDNSENIVKRVTREQLPDVVGKEVAERLLASKPWNGTYELEGEDLKIGGEGMKDFYDNILPKAIGKYVDRLGKGKVEQSEVTTFKGQSADAVTLPGGSPRKGEFTPIWRIDITPEMRAGVQEGQPLFQPVSEPAAEQTPTTLRETAIGFLPDGFTLDDLDINFDQLAEDVSDTDPVNAEELVRSAVNYEVARVAAERELGDDYDPMFAETYYKLLTGNLPDADKAFYIGNPNAMERLIRFLTSALRRLTTAIELQFDRHTATAVNRISRALVDAERGFRVRPDYVMMGGDVTRMQPTDSFAAAEQKFNNQVNEYVTGNWPDDAEGQQQRGRAFVESWLGRYDAFIAGENIGINTFGRVSPDYRRRIRSGVREITGATIEPSGSVSILIDSDIFANMPTDSESAAFNFLARGVQEEVIHAAHLKSIANRVGPSENYEASVAEDLARTYSDILSSNFNFEDPTGTFRSLANSFAVYRRDSSASPERLANPNIEGFLSADIGLQIALVAEMARQAVQLRRSGGITEQEGNWWTSIKEWFAERLNAIKRIAAYPGEMGALFERDILAIEAILDESDIRFQPVTGPDNRINHYQDVYLNDPKTQGSAADAEPRNWFQRMFVDRDDLARPLSKLFLNKTFTKRATEEQLKQVSRDYDLIQKKNPVDPDLVSRTLGSNKPTLTKADADRINAENAERLAELWAQESAAIAARESAKDEQLKNARSAFLRAGKADPSNLGAQETEYRKRSREINDKARTDIAAISADYRTRRERAMEARNKAVTDARLARVAEMRRDRDLALQELEKVSPEMVDWALSARRLIDEAQEVVRSVYGDSPDLQMVIDATKGVYLVRTYRIHQDPGYAEKFLTDPKYRKAYNQLINYFEDQLVEAEKERLHREQGETPFEIDEEEITNSRVKNKAEKLKRLTRGENISDADIEAIARKNVIEEAKTMAEDWIMGHGDSQTLVSQKSGNTIKVDFTRFLEKKDLAPELLEALGEITDPLFNATNTISSLATIAQNRKFLAAYVKTGKEIGNLITKEEYESNPNKYRGWDVLVAKDERNPAYAPLAGYYAPPEHILAFKAVINQNRTVPSSTADKAFDRVNRTIMGAAGTSLAVVVMGNPASAVRNVVGGSLLASRQGIVAAMTAPFTKKGRTAFRTVYEAIFDPKTRRVSDEKINKYVAQGVILNGVNTNHLREMYERYGSDKNTFLDKVQEFVAKGSVNAADKFSKTRKGTSTVFEYIGKIWEFSETLYNVIVYENELEKLQAAGFGTEQQMEQEAADRMRMLMPSHSEQSQGVRGLTNAPVSALIAPFIRFKTDMIRTTVNTYKLAIRDMRSGNPELVKAGQQRLASALAIDAVLTAVVPQILQGLMGIGDDEDRAIRSAMPDYAKNSNFYYYLNRSTGELTTYDLTYLNPMSFVVDPFVNMYRAVASGNPEEIPAIAASSVGQEFLGENVLAGLIIDVKRNKDDTTGKSIYLDTDTDAEKIRKSLAHIVGGAYTPAVGKVLYRTYEAATRDQEADQFFFTPVGQAANLFLPFKPRAQFVQDMAYRSFSETRAMNAQLWQTMSASRSPRPMDSSKIADMYEDRVQGTLRVWGEFYQHAKGFEALGMTRSEILATARRAGLSKDRTQQVITRGTTDLPVESAEALEKMREIDPDRVRVLREEQSKRARHLDVTGK